MEVTNKAVMEALDGLPPVKVHCSLLAEEAIHAALWDYAQKHGITIEGLENQVRYSRRRRRSRGRILKYEQKVVVGHVRRRGFLRGCPFAGKNRVMRSSASPCRSGRMRRRNPGKKTEAAVAWSAVDGCQEGCRKAGYSLTML